MSSYNYQYQSNTYGLAYNYNSMQQYPSDSSYLSNNNIYHSSNTSNDTSSESFYSPSSSYYNSSTASPQPYFQQNQAYSVSSLTNQSVFSSPKSYSYTNTSTNTPNATQYQPADYSSAYTSTPYQLNQTQTTNYPDPKVKKVKQVKLKQTGSQKRPKVIKLNVEQTNIGFGNAESVIILPSDCNDQRNSTQKSYQCTECQVSFSIAAKLFMHQHKQHKNRSSTECPICYKKFNSPANALVHLRAHTQEKTYKCEECHLGFCDSSTLKKHIRTHTGEKPYECKLCYKRFAQSGNLKRHLLVHEKYDPIQGVVHKPVEQPKEDLNIIVPTQVYHQHQQYEINQVNYDELQQPTNNFQYQTNNFNQSYNYY